VSVNWSCWDSANENSMIQVSVIIPTFRRPQSLSRCLLALERQSFPRDAYEVIVVSDGPDEISELIVPDFIKGDQRFIFLQTPLKKGPAAARNFGWKKANGSLIAFTDDDTLPDRHWLNAIWKAYNGEKLIAYSGRIKVPLPLRPTDYEKNTAGLETAEFVTANCCCTKAALEKVGGFDEQFAMAWREDSDLYFKLIEASIPVIQLPDALVVHPVRYAPWGVSIKEQKKGMFNALLYKKYPQLYRQKIQRLPAWNYYVMVICVLIFIVAIGWQIKWLTVLSVAGWLVLYMIFSHKRLRNTSRSVDHVAEMLVTSACIPFISVYWQLYGALKYRVFFM